MLMGMTVLMSMVVAVTVAVVVAVAVAVTVTVSVIVIVVVAVEKHVDGRRPDPVFGRLADLVPDREPIGHRRKGVGVGAGRNQRGANHVAGGTGPTVEDERSHDRSEATARQILPDPTRWRRDPCRAFKRLFRLRRSIGSSVRLSGRGNLFA